MVMKKKSGDLEKYNICGFKFSFIDMILTLIVLDIISLFLVAVEGLFIYVIGFFLLQLGLSIYFSMEYGWFTNDLKDKIILPYILGIFWIAVGFPIAVTLIAPHYPLKPLINFAIFLFSLLSSSILVVYISRYLLNKFK